MSMLVLGIGLFIIAIAILVIDIYIEGFGPLGIAGLIAASIALAITGFMVPFGGFIVLGKIAVTFPAIILFFRFLKSRQLDGRLILTETLAEDVHLVSGLEFFAGKEGVAKTALRPHGSVEFNGATIEVASESGYIAQGKRVKVVEVKDKKVLVALVENQN